MPGVPDEHHVLVLFGDVPLVQPATLQRLIDALRRRSARRAERACSTIRPATAASCATAPARVARIVEHKDANAKERAIDEVNTGLMAAPRGGCASGSAQLQQRQRAGRVLPDRLSSCMAVKAGLKVDASSRREDEECSASTTRCSSPRSKPCTGAGAPGTHAAGVTLVDPARFDARGPVRVGRDVVHRRQRGARRQRAHRRSRAHRPEHRAFATARSAPTPRSCANCVIDRAEVGARCIIGPFARLRPERAAARRRACRQLRRGEEDRDSKRGAKANHLTYLGDATVGEKVNVGAGTVTCNYDGVNKWRTEIGDGAFIGSGHDARRAGEGRRGATIGAGSTITKDTPAASSPWSAASR